MAEAIRERVERLLRDGFILPAGVELTPGTVLNDGSPSSIFLDSLDSVELVMLLEDEFGAQIDDDVAEGWTTVGDIYRWAEGLR